MKIAAINCPSATHPLCPFDHQLAIQRASSQWETQSTIVGNAVSGSFFSFAAKNSEEVLLTAALRNVASASQLDLNGKRK